MTKIDDRYIDISHIKIWYIDPVCVFCVQLCLNSARDYIFGECFGSIPKNLNIYNITSNGVVLCKISCLLSANMFCLLCNLEKICNCRLSVWCKLWADLRLVKFRLYCRNRIPWPEITSFTIYLPCTPWPHNFWQRSRNRIFVYGMVGIGPGQPRLAMI